MTKNTIDETASGNQPLANGMKPGLSEAGTYSPIQVYMQDTLGVVFLGLLTLTLLIAWLRAQAHNRALLAQISARR